jgi:hypothetical protein
MAAKKRRRKKKALKPKKYLVSISRKQFELLKQHCAYTQSTPPRVLKQAVSMYLKQVNHDLNHWKKISPGAQNLCEEDKARQMEINF